MFADPEHCICSGHSAADAITDRILHHVPDRCSIALFFCALLPLHGQEARGTILGRVIDQTGSVVVGAKVEATNTATGAKAQTITSSTGNYVIPNLQVGPYEVSVATTGFKAWSRSGINVKGSENVRLDVALEVVCEGAGI